MTQQELLKHNEFLLKQIEMTSKRVIRPIYRGDSLKNLCEKLNVPFLGEATNIPALLDKLFMVGEKAQRFYTEDDNFSIDEYGEFVFKKIMKYFKTSLKNKNTNTIAFFDRNTGLRNFFSVQNNMTAFLGIINQAPSNEKLAIRNYYLTLLHQLAAVNYKSKSHFVSTSSDYEIAEKFSQSNRNKSKVILHCWQPIAMEKNILKKYGLPTYSLSPYHYQREFSILGGILPHFISGLEITSKNEYYPNPNIFNADVTNNLFLNGLEIDQTNFHEVASLTNYKITLRTDGNDIWEM